MNEVKYSVSFWEEAVNGNLIPCCESSQPAASAESKNSNGKETDKDYYCVEVKECVELPSDARNCRRLLKCDYKWFLKQSINTKEAELENFLYYHVTFDPVCSMHPNVHKYNYYFRREHTSTMLNASCYLADDYGIMLLKYVANKLRYCYLDVKTFTTHQNKLFLSNLSYGVLLCNGSLWMMNSLKPSSKHLEVILIRPREGTRVSLRIPLPGRQPMFNTTLFRRPILEMVRATKSCFLIAELDRYLIFHETDKQLVPKTCDAFHNFDYNAFQNFDNIFLLGDKIVMYERYKCGVPPVLYFGNTSKGITIQKKLDFAVHLKNCKQYIPSNYEMHAYTRGMKVLVVSEESYIIIVDVSTCTIVQMLSYVPCFWQHKLSIYLSIDGQNVRLIGKSKQLYKPGYVEYLCANFPIWHGTTLKEKCIHVITRQYGLQQLKRCGLPRHVMMDLQKRYSNVELGVT